MSLLSHSFHWLSALAVLAIVVCLVIGHWSLVLSRRQWVSRALWATRRLRWPFVLLSSAVVAFLAPGLLGVWFAVLFFGFGSLPRPWRAQCPPYRVWSPQGQRWLREQRRQVAARSSRVYALWSEAQWQARSAALPWPRRRRFFTRGPV